MHPSSSLTLTPLGSGGWIPTLERQTCCYCLEIGRSLFILDAGTGMARFGEPTGARIAAKYTSINILLSHYHYDHLIGLTYLPLFFPGKQLNIFGPGKELYGKGVREILNTFFDTLFFSTPLAAFPMRLTCTDLVPGRTVIDGHQVEAVLQQHSAPSLGYRINDDIAYVTDTCSSTTTLDLAAHVRLLLHESWLDHQDSTALPQAEQDASQPMPHTSIDQVLHVACHAQVERLMLIHLNPSYAQSRLDNMLVYARHHFADTLLATDNQQVTLGTIT